jgi:hypothetical protein
VRLSTVQRVQMMEIPLRQGTPGTRGPGNDDTEATHTAIRQSGLSAPHPLIDAFLIEGDLELLQGFQRDGMSIHLLQGVAEDRAMLRQQPGLESFDRIQHGQHCCVLRLAQMPWCLKVPGDFCGESCSIHGLAWMMWGCVAL